MGHDCIWGTVRGDQWEEEGVKKRILRGEEDGNTLYIHMYMELS
jgi:hypothetical protein